MVEHRALINRKGDQVSLANVEYSMFSSSYIAYAPVTSIPTTSLFYQHPYSPQIRAANSTTPTKSVLQPAGTGLALSKEDPLTTTELGQYNGSDLSKPIYVAIKGDISDVTHRADVYGSIKACNVFTGKDGSYVLGESSLKVEAAIVVYSTLDA